MRKVLIICLLVVALALVAAPALAAPPLHKVTYSGQGITADQGYVYDDIIGHHVYFSGAGMMSAGGIWQGQGSFVDKDTGLKAQLVVNNGIYCSAGNDFTLYGLADVTEGKVKVGTYPFQLRLESSGAGVAESYQLIIQKDILETSWSSWYVVPGIKGNQLVIKSK